MAVPVLELHSSVWSDFTARDVERLATAIGSPGSVEYRRTEGHEGVVLKILKHPARRSQLPLPGAPLRSQGLTESASGLAESKSEK